MPRARQPVEAFVQCPWCDSRNPSGLTHCQACGGPLPAPAGPDPGPPPPPPPRQLPGRYRRAVMLFKNVEVILGLVFTVVFCWSVIFPIIGIFLLLHGRRKGQAQLEALERGHAARGLVVDVRWDRSVTVNGRNPLLIEYIFDANGKTWSGRVHAWRPEYLRWAPDDDVWVVYLPENPEVNSIWPPVK